MTDRELLELLVKKIDNLDNKMNNFENDMQGMRQDIQGIKQEQTAMKQGIQGIKQEQTAMKQDIQGMKQEQTAMKQAIVFIESKVSILEDEVKQNTLVLENTINKCIAALLEGYQVNAERIDRFNPESMQIKLNQAVNLAELVNYKVDKFIKDNKSA